MNIRINRPQSRNLDCGGRVPHSATATPLLGKRTKPMSPSRSLSGCATPAQKRNQSGFTLAEALAALTFMAILIPVALEGLHIASRAGEVAARKSEASLVAESVLNETVVTTNYLQNGQSGTTRQGAHDYQWSVRNDPWNQDVTLSGMRLLSIDVQYLVQGRQYSVRLSTLVDSTPPNLQPTVSTP